LVGEAVLATGMRREQQLMLHRSNADGYDAAIVKPF
jgi:hypothetical protein